MQTLIRRAVVVLALVVCCAALPGCSCDGVAGTYSDAEDAVTLELRGDGKAYVSLGELGTNAGTWEQDGEKVIITINGDSTVLTRNDDGSLNGGMMLGTLKKKD